MVDRILNFIVKACETVFEFIVYAVSVVWNFLKSIGTLVINTYKGESVPVKEPGILSKGDSPIILFAIAISVILIISFSFTICLKYKNEK